MRRLLVPVLVLLLVAAGFLFVLAQPQTPPPRDMDWPSLAKGPRDAVRVAWVGHSMINARNDRVPDSVNLMGKVGQLAAARGQEYDSVDHTLWGSPLSALWTGNAHGFDRGAQEMIPRREALQARTGLDAMVLTELLPVSDSIRYEHSPYYLQKFACAFWQKNPQGRVYLYESWLHITASENGKAWAPPADWSLHQVLAEQRPVWLQIASQAMTGQVPPPGAMARVQSRLRGAPAECEGGPIFFVPVSRVLKALDEGRTEAWTVNGQPFDLSYLVSNPYAGFPPPAGKTLGDLSPRDASRDVDDIHPSDLGVYLLGLIHYAVLYRQSPVGLPSFEGLSEAANLGFQETVWKVLREEPRAGIQAS